MLGTAKAATCRASNAIPHLTAKNNLERQMHEWSVSFEAHFAFRARAGCDCAAAPGFHRADAHRQAAHGPHFILGLARPAVARRSCQTLERMTLPHNFIAQTKVAEVVS